MSELNVILPGLLWPDIGDYDYLYQQLDLPLFSRLFSRAKLTQHPFKLSDFAYQSCLMDNGLSLAETYARQLNLGVEFKGYLLVEPTHLRVDRDRLLISEAELLQLNEQEAQQIIAALNQHFKAQLRFYYLNSELWLVGLNLEINGLTSHPILDIVGENIDEFLPTASNSLELHQLLNEIQMLLFNLPLNQLRQEEGLLAVNSLWLWDKSCCGLPFELSRTLSNNPKLGSQFSQLVEGQLAAADCLIIDQAYYPSCYRDSFSWLQIMRQLEEQLAGQLIQELKRRKLSLWLPTASGSWQFSLNPSDLWKFWRNSSLLATFKALSL